jgi:hypothetical protein
MSLTAVTPARSTLNAAGFASDSLQIPRVLNVIAIDTGDAKGAAITQSSTQAPAAILVITGDADWYWSQTDGLATTSMNLVRAGSPYPLQCSPNLTQNIYMKTSATANITVTMVA